MIRRMEPGRPVRLMHVTTVPQTLQFLVGHVAYAKERGVEVHALSSSGDWLDRFAHETEVEVHAVEMARRITPLRDLAALGRIIRVMRRVRPTIVHGHTPKGGLLAMLAARWCNVPVRVYHVHGLPMVTAHGIKRRLLGAAERTSCRLAHQVFCLCPSLRDLALAEGLGTPAKMKVLNHGSIDGIEAQERFNPARVPAEARQAVRRRYNIPPDALVAGFAGRIVRDKGVIELVQAWQLLRAEFPTLHLLVAGPFESVDPIPAEVEAVLRSDPRIHLAGMVMDMPPVYAALDLLVSPTYREGFGVVFLEANAMELPVVATRIPGCVDAVRDGETGLLVPPRDAEALAAAVRLYLRDADLRRRHGEEGRARALRDFNPQAMRETLFQEYVRLIEEKLPAEFAAAGVR
jgi:glycosyltransferase involved in cell wall biosynthesis